MKIAVISDVHGNVPAMEAVIDDLHAWQPDQVVINGDLVNRGPYSSSVLAIMRARFSNAVFIKGNHETFVLHAAEHSLSEEDPKYHLHQFAEWSARQLGEDNLSVIRGWYDHYDVVDPNGKNSLHITHGSRLGNRDGISLKTQDEALPEKLGERKELFVVSHTHKAMLRHFEDTLIINTGSVGQPLDNDPRSAYARIEYGQQGWQGEIRRVAYDKAQAEKDFIESGFLDEGGPLTKLIFLEHRHNKMFVGPFMHKYHDAIVAGEVNANEAVDFFLQHLGVTLDN